MKYLKEFKLIGESIDNKSLFLSDFGMFITMNLAHVAQRSIDDISKKELISMVGNINKPLVNGLNYAELINSELIKNPKIYNALITKINEIILYIEPRIKRFVKDSEVKTVWLSKISDFKNRISLI